ncbi:hypothetical protein PanWU01x14_285130, partial [Parasponia andersonii]
LAKGKFLTVDKLSLVSKQFNRVLTRVPELLDFHWTSKLPQVRR